MTQFTRHMTSSSHPRRHFQVYILPFKFHCHSCKKKNKSCFSLLRRGLFRLSGRLGNVEKENKARGSWGEGKRTRTGDTGKGKEKERDEAPSFSPLQTSTARPRFFNFLVFILFPCFLAVSQLKEPLRRRVELLGNV